MLEIGAVVFVRLDAKLRLVLVGKAEVLRLVGIGTRRLPFLALAIAAEEVAIEQAFDLLAGRRLHLPAFGLPFRLGVTRLRPVGGRGRDRRAADREILLELVARHEKPRADRVEGAGACVGWQARRVDLDAEQVAERVAILAAVEPTDERDLALVADRLAGGGEGLRKIGEELELGVGLGLRLFGGGHLAGIEDAKHLLPAFGRLDRGDGKWQVVEPDAALLGLFRVALHAVGREERLMA